MIHLVFNNCELQIVSGRPTFLQSSLFHDPCYFPKTQAPLLQTPIPFQCLTHLASWWSTRTELRIGLHRIPRIRNRPINRHRHRINIPNLINITLFNKNLEITRRLETARDDLGPVFAGAAAPGETGRNICSSPVSQSVHVLERGREKWSWPWDCDLIWGSAADIYSSRIGDGERHSRRARGGSDGERIENELNARVYRECRDDCCCCCNEEGANWYHCEELSGAVKMWVWREMLYLSMFRFRWT